MELNWMIHTPIDRLQNFMNYLDERNQCGLIMLLPQHNGVRISVHEVGGVTPALFEGTGIDINAALDDLLKRMGLA